MSIYVEDLRGLNTHLGDAAAGEIEELEKAYALLFAENAELRAQVEEQRKQLMLEAAREIVSDIQSGRAQFLANVPRNVLKTEAERIGWDEAAHEYTSSETAAQAEVQKPVAWQEPDCPRRVLSDQDKRDFLRPLPYNGPVTNRKAAACTAPLFSAPTPPRVQQWLEAMEKLLNTFPTDDDMVAAGYDKREIDNGCNAYEQAQAAITSMREWIEEQRQKP